MAINQQSLRIGTRLALMEISGELCNMHPGRLTMADMADEDLDLIARADNWEYTGTDQIIRGMLWMADKPELKSNKIWIGDVLEAYDLSLRRYQIFFKLRFLKIDSRLLGISHETLSRMKAGRYCLEDGYMNSLDAAVSVDSALAQLFFYYFQARFIPLTKSYKLPLKWICGKSIQSFLDGDLDQQLIQEIEDFKPDRYSYL